MIRIFSSESKAKALALFQDMQMTEPTRRWLHAGWSEAVGLSIAIEDRTEPMLGASSSDREFAGMSNSVLSAKFFGLELAGFDWRNV